MREDEFLEFIGRISNALYSNPEKAKTLEENIDLFLVGLFGLVKALKYPPYIPEDSSEDEEEENFDENPR